jgi:hypothetical protein
MVPLHRTAPLPDFWSVDIESGTNASFSKKNQARVYYPNVNVTRYSVVFSQVVSPRWSTADPQPQAPRLTDAPKTIFDDRPQ